MRFRSDLHRLRERGLFAEVLHRSWEDTSIRPSSDRGKARLLRMQKFYMAFSGYIAECLVFDNGHVTCSLVLPIT